METTIPNKFNNAAREQTDRFQLLKFGIPVSSVNLRFQSPSLSADWLDPLWRSQNWRESVTLEFLAGRDQVGTG